MKPLILILILFIISTPVYADKGKGIFTHMYLDEDLDVFTSNVSETPGHIYDNQSAVESDILNVQDWMNIGKTQLKSENWKPAEEVFSQVIKQEPKNTEGWEGYLLAIRGEENFEKLLEASEQATKENPDFASAWKYNGIALSSLSQSEEALKAFDTALSVDPSYYTVLYYKGIALDSLHRFDESVKAYEEVLSFNGNYTKAWNNKGVALSQIGRYEEALVAFDKALEIEPGYQMATKNKERVLQVQKGSYITNADVIDDSAEFNPIGIGDNSGGVPSVITMSPTPSPTIVLSSLPQNEPKSTPIPDVTISDLAPYEFYGYVQIDGKSAPVGTDIQAHIDNNIVTTYVTSYSGSYGGPGQVPENPRLVVPIDEDDIGKVISIWINSNKVGESLVINYDGERIIRKDLNSVEYKPEIETGMGIVSNEMTVSPSPDSPIVSSDNDEGRGYFSGDVIIEEGFLEEEANALNHDEYSNNLLYEVHPEGPMVTRSQSFFGKAEFNGYPLRVGDQVMATREGVDLSESKNPLSVIKFGEYGNPTGKEMLIVNIPNESMEISDPITFWIKPQDFDYWYKAEVKGPSSNSDWIDSYPFTPDSVTNVDVRSDDRADFMYFYDIVETIKNVNLPDDYSHL